MYIKKVITPLFSDVAVWSFLTTSLILTVWSSCRCRL